MGVYWCGSPQVELYKYLCLKGLCSTTTSEKSMWIHVPEFPPWSTPLYNSRRLMMFDEHTYLCLHWCYAHLNAVLELGTYAAEVPVYVSHVELGCTAHSIIS